VRAPASPGPDLPGADAGNGPKYKTLILVRESAFICSRLPPLRTGAKNRGPENGHKWARPIFRPHMSGAGDRGLGTGGNGSPDTDQPCYPRVTHRDGGWGSGVGESTDPPIPKLFPPRVTVGCG